MPGTQLFYMRGLEICASWSSQYTQASAGALEQTDMFLIQAKSPKTLIFRCLQEGA